jgi:hypothetical protein
MSHNRKAISGVESASRKTRRKAGKAGAPVTYGMTTSSGTWRTHLLSAHAEEWAEACKSINATIKSKRAAHLTQGGLNALEDDVQFSPDNFVDACADFVAEDDQVRTHHAYDAVR